MTPVWDKTMSAESAKELLELLNSRNIKVDNVEPITYFVHVAEGDYDNVNDPDGRIRGNIESYFNRVMQQIAPPETILKDSFWDTNAGQLLAAVQYWLYGKDTVTVSQAAQAIYGESDNGAIASTLRLIERGRIQAIRKPEDVFTARRKTSKTGQGTNRSRLVIKSSLDAYLKERV